jgi:hypothetical protein
MREKEQCNVSDIKSAQRLPCADTVARLRAPIVVTIRGRESRVVKVAQQSYKTRIA